MICESTLFSYTLDIWTFVPSSRNAGGSFLPGQLFFLSCQLCTYLFAQLALIHLNTVLIRICFDSLRFECFPSNSTHTFLLFLQQLDSID